MALLQQRGIATPGSLVLDLACGAGRHAQALEAAGARVTGVDLSMVQLRSAQGRGIVRLARADMRYIPIRTASMDTVVNLFTSFGYFDRDEEHARVLAEVARVLKPGGAFAMDFLNAPHVRRTLVPRDERVVGGRRVVQERSISDTGRFVVKHIHLEGEREPFVERVRLLAREDIEAMAQASGLRTESVFGDYDGSAHSPSSTRFLLLARKA